MPRGLDVSNIERAFIQEALAQRLRIDGRAFDQLRSLDIDLGDEYGTATVRLGQTKYVTMETFPSLWLILSRVLVQVSAEVSKPLEDRKFDGIFNIVTELSPIASAAFEFGR
jgi:exosome complex component RRP45